MSYKSYSASERRGILIIAIIALLITGGGIWLSFLGPDETSEGAPRVQVIEEAIDSVASSQNKKTVLKKTGKGLKDAKKNKSKKEYKKRNPLDEPV